MLKKGKLLILIILLIGLIYRLFISSNGNFIFNMDNGRDMIDVREMVVLKHLRLIGPTTSIDGVFYGPVWYYMLSIPFILSGGNPFASILMEIILWVVGGYFLLILVRIYYGNLATFAVGLIWIASNFILLGSQYAFNPNPILFLTPIFIWSLLKFLENEKIIYQILAFFLAGLFLQFSVPVGIFAPIVILIFSGISLGLKYFKSKVFFIGVLTFLITLLPQFIFDLRYNFAMTHALVLYRSTSHGDIVTNPNLRFPHILESFSNVLLPTFENFEIFTKIFLFSLVFCIFWIFRSGKLLNDKLTLLCLLLLAVPIIGLIPLRVDLLGWYFNASLIAALVLVGFVLKTFQGFKGVGKIVANLLVFALLVFTIKNMSDYISAARKEDGGNSLLKNETAVIDYTYRQANGRNFKVYIYLPSVIDYPYQYLYWWYGLKKYGFLPKDFAYLPDKPEYIKQKQKFNTGSHPENSGLVFLIKEPDQIGQRHLWENNFKNLELLDSQNIGSIIVETVVDTRKE